MRLPIPQKERKGLKLERHVLLRSQKKNNNFAGSLDFTRLPKSIRNIYLSENRFSGTIDLGNLPESMWFLNVKNNALSGTLRVAHGVLAILGGNEQLRVKRVE